MRHADGRTEALTVLEQRLLAFFVKNAGRIISRQELLKEVWGVPDRVPTRTLDIAISRLRAKVEPDPANPRYLLTHRGLGYRYEARRSGARRVRARIDTEAGWLDLERRTVRTSGVETTLGDREADLLAMLLEHPGEPVGATELLHALWGRGLDTGRVRTALSRLRHKLEEDPARPSHLITTADGVVFQPLATSVPPHRTNVVESAGLFVGRIDAVRRATSEVRGGRTVMVRGPAGLGKSRLLAELAVREAVAQRVWPGGVWMVSVEHCSTVDEVAAQLARVLGLSLAGRPGITNLQRVVGALGRWGRSLLLLDDAHEAAVPVGSFIARLASEVEDLGVIVASRARLGLRGGHELTLQPLNPTDSERLLMDRLDAAAAPADFAGDPALVSRIAARLEGVPLALELAAGQATVVGARRLLESLSWGRPLAGASPSASSLDGVLSASWSLLAEGEAGLLSALSVWSGPFGVAEAQGVAAQGVFVPGLLQSLCRTSLLRPVAAGLGDTPQLYTMGDAARRSALRRLKRAGHEESVLARQRDWLVRRVESLAKELVGPRPGDALERLEVLRLDALRTASSWRRTLPGVAARLQLGLWRATQWTRPAQELANLLERAEGAAAASGDHLLHARAILLRSRAGASGRGLSEVLPLAARGRDMARAAGDPRLEAFGHLLVGVALYRQGRLEASQTTLERARQLLKGCEDRDLEARVWMAMASTARQLSGPASALAAHRQALLAAQRGGCRATLVRAHLRQGWELLVARKWQAASEELSDALDASRELPWPEERARVLGLLGRACLEAGDLDRTERRVDEALELEQRCFPDLGALQPRTTLALLRVEQGRYREAEEEGLKLGKIMEQHPFGERTEPLFVRGLARLVGGRPGAAALFGRVVEQPHKKSAANALEAQLCLAVASALEGDEVGAAAALDRARTVFAAGAELAGLDRNMRMASAIVGGSISAELRAETASVPTGELGFLGRVFRSLLRPSP